MKNVQSLTFRLPHQLDRKLSKAAHRLNLSRSEIARRSIALGLRHFDTTELPG
jgi:predicted transcriptional regulator